MNLLLEHWSDLVSLSGLIAVLGAIIRYGPRALRRFGLMMDCEFDRVRWEEADRLRNREIALLRQDVANLLEDIERLQRRSGVSGASSDGATTPASRSSRSRPTSSGM